MSDDLEDRNGRFSETPPTGALQSPAINQALKRKVNPTSYLREA